LNKAIITLILFLIFIPFSFSQNQLDSLDIIKSPSLANYFYNGFDKELNTFNLHSLLLMNIQSEKFKFNIKEDYNSTYIRSTDASTRDEHVFSAAGSYDVSTYYDVGMKVDNDIYSDSRQIDINEASASSLIMFSRIKPLDSLTIAPFAGYENNRQIGQSDYGAVYGGEGLLNNYTASDIILLSQFKYKNEDISPRKNAVRYFNFAAIDTLGSDFKNKINFQYYENRKDFYYKADSVTSVQFDITNNIQSRIETVYVLEDSLYYNKFLNLFSLDLAGRYTWRTVDYDTRYRSLSDQSISSFDTKIDQSKLEIEGTTSYNSEDFFGALKFTYSDIDETHIAKNFPGSILSFYEQRSNIEGLNDNNAEYLTLSFMGGFKLSSSDILNFSLYQNKLQYDTPSPGSYDTRDELLSIVKLNYTKQLNPFFNVFIETEGTMHHIVYIYTEESANNNINRIISLSTGCTYSGSNVTSTNSFGVSANYTVYDFEDIIPNDQSYSFRQFTAMDSSRIKLDYRLDFVHYGYVKLSEQGDLAWASFSTTPTRFLQEVYSIPKFVLYYDRALISLGLRIYSLNSYNYQGLTKVLNSSYLSVGPLTEFSLLWSSSLNISLLGWYEFVTNTDQADIQQANLSLNIKWNF
jgi:hypothetical protein